MKKRFHIGLLILTAVILVCIISAAVSALVCRSSLAVHEYNVQIDRLQQPFTAVVLTDLHGREFGKENEALLSQVKAQRPDVIFSIGDMINQDADQAEVLRFIELLARLREIAPVYVSYGNHEKAYMRSGGTDLAPGIEAAGAVLLDESCVTAELGGNKVCLGGTVGHLYPFGRTPEEYHASPEYRLMKQMETSGLPTIVLAHLPDTIIFVEAYKDWDIDLFLSGHTHGGVIRLPFFGGLYAPMQGWFPDEDMGYFNYGRVQLLISSGLAGHGKVPRVFNMPEVCVVHIS